MYKWILGVFVFILIMVVLIEPEWFKLLSAVFSDFIRANE